MDKPFVLVVDIHGKKHIINLLHLVEMRHEPDSWEVWLVKGDPITLNADVGEKLLRRLPGAEPKRQLNVH